LKLKNKELELKKYALLSVSDKSKIELLGKELHQLGYGILATGKTAKLLKENGIDTIEVSDFTGSPEVFDGRVKTLHPKIFGGILFRREESNDIKQAEANSIEAIDIVCVNLYPFEKTARNPDAELSDLIENIDIGGPSLIRAAAKNYKYVSVLTSPEQYENFIAELKSGEVTIQTREKLAVEAYSHTADYDVNISGTLEKKFKIKPDKFRLSIPILKELRYGENPHQKAEVCGSFYDYFEPIHGKELSYNNILDLSAAVELVEELGANSCAIIKHNNPCGAAKADTTLNAYLKALTCDPVSAFGGIVVVNEEVNEELAIKLNEIFLEVVCAPSFSEAALTVLHKKKDRRLVKKLKNINDNEFTFRSIPGGLLLQSCDRVEDEFANLKSVTDRKPSESEIEDLKFAWIVCKHVKSNAIVFVKDKMTVGVGAGQVSRVDSAKIAAIKAKQFGLELKGSVVASDAFFPFADGLLEVVNNGAVAVIQPGGSVRDAEVIDAANKNNTAMVFTGIRHFKH